MKAKHTILQRVGKTIKWEQIQKVEGVKTTIKIREQKV